MGGGSRKFLKTSTKSEQFQILHYIFLWHCSTTVDLTCEPCEYSGQYRRGLQPETLSAVGYSPGFGPSLFGLFLGFRPRPVVWSPGGQRPPPPSGPGPLGPEAPHSGPGPLGPEAPPVAPAPWGQRPPSGPGPLGPAGGEGGSMFSASPVQNLTLRGAKMASRPPF